MSNRCPPVGLRSRTYHESGEIATRSPAEVVTRLSDQPDREILEGGAMKATYDARTDTLSIILKPDA
jgi:hypothetical protein